MRVRRSSLLLLLTLVACCVAAADSPERLWARDDFPIPPENPRRVFFLQRSTNMHTIVYEARLADHGRLDAAQPLDVYWLRGRSQERRPLDFIERTFAFGPRVMADPTAPGTWVVSTAGYPARTARLTLDARGKPMLVTEVAGRRARLVSGYLELDGSGYMPRVLAVHLYGIDVRTGAWLHERFVP